MTFYATLPAGLLQKKSQEGTQTTMEATLMAQQTPAQREQVCHGLHLHVRLMPTSSVHAVLGLSNMDPTCFCDLHMWLVLIRAADICAQELCLVLLVLGRAMLNLL